MEYLKRDYLLNKHHIMDICDVTERTARRWISGETQIPKPMKRLLELELSGKIIPESWPKHWRFNHLNLMETETCHPALSWQQITWYSYAIQGWQQALNKVPEIEDAIKYLMDKLPTAEVIQLEQYRAEMKEMRRRSQMSANDAVELAREHLTTQNKKEQHRTSGC